MANPVLTKALTERSKSYETPYEFVFRINNNIIAQRFFNVSPYNPNSVSSYELKEMVDECVRMIQAELKMRTVVFMDEYKYYFEEDPKYDWNDSPDKYHFQVKINKKVVIENSWEATLYPAKIRYDVNIKKYISRIIYLISSILSAPDNELTMSYLDQSLMLSDTQPDYSVEEAKHKKYYLTQFNYDSAYSSEETK